MLLLSLITLFAGPLLFQWLSRSGRVARTLDHVIVVVLIVLVVVLLVPDIIEPLGLAAPGFLLLGYLLPGLLEQSGAPGRRDAAPAQPRRGPGRPVAARSARRGGLAGSSLRHEPGLAAAIILHRFGVGLMLWLIVQPVFGVARLADPVRDRGRHDRRVRVFRTPAAAGGRPAWSRPCRA